MAYDLRAAVTSWVIQELAGQAPGEDLGYWVNLMGADTAMPRVAITILARDASAMKRATWPPDNYKIRAAVRLALEEIAEIRAKDARSE